MTPRLPEVLQHPSRDQVSALLPPPTVFAPRAKVDAVDSWIFVLGTLMIIAAVLLCRPRPPS